MRAVEEGLGGLGRTAWRGSFESRGVEISMNNADDFGDPLLLLYFLKSVVNLQTKQSLPRLATDARFLLRATS